MTSAPAPPPEAPPATTIPTPPPLPVEAEELISVTPDGDNEEEGDEVPELPDRAESEDARPASTPRPPADDEPPEEEDDEPPNSTAANLIHESLVRKSRLQGYGDKPTSPSEPPVPVAQLRTPNGLEGVTGQPPRPSSPPAAAHEIDETADASTVGDIPTPQTPKPLDQYTVLKAVEPPPLPLVARLRGKPAAVVCELLGKHLEDVDKGRCDDAEELSPELWAHVTANELRRTAFELLMCLDTFTLREEPSHEDRMPEELENRLGGLVYVLMTAAPTTEFAQIRLALLSSYRSTENSIFRAN